MTNKGLCCVSGLVKKQGREPVSDLFWLDGSGNVDTQRGIRLGEAGVEIISVFQEEKRKAFVGEKAPLEQTGSHPGNEFFGVDSGRDQPAIRSNETENAVTLESGEEVRSPRSMHPGQGEEGLMEEGEEDWREEEDLEEEEDWEVIEEQRLDAFLDRSEVDIRQERAAIARKITEEDEQMHTFRLDAVFYRRLEAAGKREGTSTPDGTLTVLLDGYEWLHRGGIE